MYTVELWAQGAGFARFLQARLPGEAGGCLRLGPGAQRADLVVAAPDLAALPPNPAPCRALLLPGHLAPLCLALQRELVTLGGVCREPQEIPLAPQGRADPLALLAWAGTLLLLGAPPERLQGP